MTTIEQPAAVQEPLEDTQSVATVPSHDAPPTAPVRPQDAAIRVVGATEDDLPELMRLLREMHAENAVWPLDEDTAREAFLKALRPPKQVGIIGVIRGEGSEIRAAIYLVIGRAWYTAAWHIEENFLYVSPRHRDSKCGDALLRYAQHAADQLKIGLVIGILTNKRMMPKVRMYQRRFGRPNGATFVHGIAWANEKAPDLTTWKSDARDDETASSFAPISFPIPEIIVGYAPNG